MKRKYLPKIPLVIGSIALLFSAVMLAWRLIPPESTVQDLRIPAGRLAASPDGMDVNLSRAIDLRLHFPSKLRAGEKNKLRLEVEASDPDNAGDQDAMMPIGLSAELTLFSVDKTPQGMITTGFDGTHPISFSWEVESSEVGMREGSLWVTLIFTDQEDGRIEVPVAAIDIQVEVVRLWGMNARTVLWVAFAGLLLWGGMILLGLKLEYASKNQK